MARHQCAAGASYVLDRCVRMGGDLRVSRGGPAGEADSYTASLALVPILPQNLELRLRSTHYRTVNTAGWLQTLAVGADPVSPLHLELSGGARTERLLDSLGVTAGVGAASASSEIWLAASADVNLRRSWYFLVSATRDASGVDLTHLIYASVVCRF